MRVLIASDLYPPVINGVATFSHNLAHGLSAAGHEVIVIAPSQTGKQYSEQSGGVTVHRVRSVVFPFYQNIRICIAPQLEVRNIIKEFRPDIIHSQMVLGIGQATTMIGRRYGIPIVSTSHAMPENLMDNLKNLSAFSRPINYMLADIGRRYHSKSDIVTSPTQSGIDSLSRFTSKVTVPIEVISNGIDLKAYRSGSVSKSLYHTYNLPTNKPIITYIGRLDAEKHVWVLLHALREVLKEREVHMLIVGSGVDLEHEKQIAQNIGVADHVTFTGRVSDEDKKALHRVGALFVVASPVELQCIAALEAMASGKPLVAVDAGALGELCHHGKNGELFALDDYQGAARAIVRVLSDKNLLEVYGKESRRIAQMHDLDRVIKKFIQLYETTIARKKKEIAMRSTK